MQLNDVIKSRTSYRGNYEKTPVKREDLQAILQSGLDAPSGCNAQTTSLIAVDDPAMLDKLYRIFTSDRDNALSTERVAPAMICVLTQRKIVYADVCLAVQDYSAAIENMLLTIVDLGYQSCWIEGQVTGPDNTGRKMADALGVPKDYDLVCVLPVGYATEATRHVRKKDFSKRAWFNGFGK